MVSITPRILLSDDDAAFRSVLAECLSRRGYDVIATGDGREAIEAWEEGLGQFHLCLVDFHMPRANGIEVIRHVLATPAANPACVLMSAELTEAIRAEAEAAHAYRVLTKPLRIKTLWDVIQSAFRDDYRLT